MFHQQPADGVGEERRIDEQDGNLYTRSSFLEFYGEQDGQERWLGSRVPSPLPRFDAPHFQAPELASYGQPWCAQQPHGRPQHCAPQQALWPSLPSTQDEYADSSSTQEMTAASGSAVGGGYQPQHQLRFPHPHRETCDQDYPLHVRSPEQASYGQPQCTQQPHCQPQYYAPQQALAQAGQQPSMRQPRQQAGYAPSEQLQCARALTGNPGIRPYQVPFPAHPQQLQPMPPGSIGLSMPEQAPSRPMQAGVNSFQQGPIPPALHGHWPPALQVLMDAASLLLLPCPFSCFEHAQANSK